MSTQRQPEFAQALLRPDEPVPPGLTDGAGRHAGRRFDVYRNNVAVSLTEALHQAFPTVAKLLGKPNMDGLAAMYLRRHPPRSPRMMEYGRGFPEFLAAEPQLAHLGYLPDMARLDEMMRRAYHAADVTAIAPDSLAALPPDDLGRVCFTLAPPVQILTSDWPVHDIWAFNMAGGQKPRAMAQEVLVTRPEYDPLPHLLPAGGYAFVRALGEGACLAEAAAPLPDTFDLGTTLGLLLSGGALTSLSMKDL